MASGKIILFPARAPKPNPVVDYDPSDFDITPAYRPGLEARRGLVERYTGGFKCEDCGDQILPSRLRVKPNATRCVDCQIEAESKGWSAKQYKNPRP